MRNYKLSIVCLLIIFAGTVEFSIPAKEQLFEEIPSSYSGIHFNNLVEIYAEPPKDDSYPYAYNSSGIGVGDFNNDGLPDLFFSGNTVENKLYINQGKFAFTDVSAQAGITGNHTWGTGVSVADINGDGLLDVYVSHSGKFKNAEQLKNELFINQGIKNGIPVFKEMAATYGLDLPGTHTTQVVFFDYDHDGDLDAFVLNHGLEPYSVLRAAGLNRQNFDPLNSDMLLRNDHGHFVDVSKQSGIIGSNVNFGLGVVVTDVNNDGWPDIYCSNDYSENDFLYINQKNGTFKESSAASFTHFSAFSMGTDISDINNDGLPDIVTLDMKGDNHYRQKMSVMSDNEDDFSKNVNLGFHPQYMRNMMHLNTGIDKSGVPHFTEIGQMAGIAATDWSWSALLADFDNDGWKDLFISTGYPDDMSMDTRNNFIESKKNSSTPPLSILKSKSWFFKNARNNTFTDITGNWKPERYAMSYSAVYADFDNDGKLDMVISNINDEPIVLRNSLHDDRSGFLTVSLKQKGLNDFAIGAKVKLKTGKTKQLQELEPIRGYQASQDYALHFGMGSEQQADIEVVWPDGTVTEQKAVKTNQHIVIEKKQTITAGKPSPERKYGFTEINISGKDSFICKQSDHPDFKYHFSLPYKISDFGQVVTAGDINGDGFTDYYIGGDAGSEKFFIMGQANGLFHRYNPACFERSDDNSVALLIDLDKDGDLDLLIESRSGRVKQPQLYFTDTLYQCRLYENLGGGKFIEHPGVMPKMAPFKTIAAGDLDKDGDPDLFIGGYPAIMKFGKKTLSYILRNDSKPGKFVFTDITETVLPGNDLGMVTAAEWKDLNNDHYPELLVAGEWTSCKFFRNNKGKLVDESSRSGLDQYTGLWNAINAIDVNGDGYLDLVVGNIGQNNSFMISRDHPAKLNMIDFENGRNGLHLPIPMVSAWYPNGHEYLNLYRDELLSVSQRLRPLFNTYDAYASTDLPELIQKTGARIDTVFTCNTQESGVFLNDGKGHFHFTPFPQYAQISRVNTIADLSNEKALPDLFLAGNYFGYRVQYGRQDALPIVQLKNSGNGLDAVLPGNSGLFVTGQVSKMYLYSFRNKKRILLFKKNEAPQLFEKNE